MDIHRSQFILIKSSFSSTFNLGWRAKICGDFTLFTHPELPIHIEKKEDRKLILLGFAFYVLDESWMESDILSNAPMEEGAFLDHLDCLSGNFIILVQQKEKLTLYHDCGAVMKMFFRQKSRKIQGVASDPKLLGRFFNLRENENPNARAFWKGKNFMNNLIRIGSLTSYSDVFQVLPNRKLEVNTGKVVRYFPREKRKEIPISEAIQMMDKLWLTSIRAVAKRFNIKSTLTAGWDSRMVLAICREQKKNIDFFTFHTAHHGSTHLDIKLSSRITEKLGLSFKRIALDKNMDCATELAFRDSFQCTRKSTLQVALNCYGLHDKKEDIILTGFIAEITKCYYDQVVLSDGKSVAQAAHFPLNPYIVDHFQSKFEELAPVADAFGYDVRDLMHWEQDVTNFAAQNMLFLNTVARVYSPFNCRLIIKTILSTPRNSRDKQQHKLYNAYLKKYWPELATFPINPSLKKRLMVIGKRLGIYYLYKVLSTKLRQ